MGVSLGSLERENKMLAHTWQEITCTEVKGVLSWCTSYSRQNRGTFCCRDTVIVESSFVFTGETGDGSQLCLQADTSEF